MKQNRFNRPINGADGLSLIEMLVGMAMSIVIMLALTMAIQTESRSSSREVNRVDLIHNLQNAAEHVRRDLRMAGYQNGDTGGMNVGAITVANANSITFVYDDDNDSATPQAEFTYRMDIDTDTGYDMTQNHPRLVRVNGAGGAFPVGSDITGVTFEYWTIGGISKMTAAELATQTGRDSIHTIVVSIQGQSASVDVDRGAKLTDQLGFRVKPRNFP